MGLHLSGLFEVFCTSGIGANGDYAPRKIPMTMVGNDEVLIACAAFFNAVGLRLRGLIVETSIAADGHTCDIHQGDSAISAGFLLRVIQTDIAVDCIVSAPRGFYAVTGVIHTSVVGNHVVLVTAIGQTTDAVPTISIKGASADNRVADMHAKIESIPSIVSPNVVRPEAVLHGSAGVESRALPCNLRQGSP